MKRHAVALAFGLATVRAGLSYAPVFVVARVNKYGPESSPVAAIAIANVAWFGGGMHLAPTAHPKVTVSQGANVFAAPAGGTDARGIVIEADGEIVGQLPARFTVRPAALALLT